MPDPSSHDQPHGSHAGEPVAYERSDVNIGVIIRFGVGLAVVLILVQLIILAMGSLMIQRGKEAQPKLSKLVEQERKQLPKDLKDIPAPRLQQHEKVELKELEARQNALLQRDETDPKTGVKYIPIEQAIKILADPKQQGKHGIQTKAK